MLWLDDGQGGNILLFSLHRRERGRGCDLTRERERGDPLSGGVGVGGDGRMGGGPFGGLEETLHTGRLISKCKYYKYAHNECTKDIW